MTGVREMQHALGATLALEARRSLEVMDGLTPSGEAVTSDSLTRLCEAFGLDPQERFVIAVLAGQELYLDDRPTVTGAMLGTHTGFDVWRLLAPAARLRAWHLVHLVGEGPLLQRRLVLDQRVLFDLMGFPSLDEALRPSVRPGLNDGHRQPDIPGTCLSALDAGSVAWLVHAGAGDADRIAGRLMEERRTPFVVVDTTMLRATIEDPVRRRILLEREFRLAGVGYVMAAEHADAALVDALTAPVVFLGPTAPDLHRRSVVRCPDVHRWLRQQRPSAVVPSSVHGIVNVVDVRARWSDLVVPAPQRQLLQMIVQQVRHLHQVYVDWAFASSSSRGLGVTAVFAGPSGTGKTMAAEVMASELGRPLWTIDLSAVVSKYIGETEKNLALAFSAAEEIGAVLLFDEADALFGKRTEVQDSHDRYANVEVSYLLQRMEEYHGLAILTTNRPDDLDQAFLRRLRFVVPFPFPDVDRRREIWMKAFPAAAPCGDDIRVDLLARHHLTGGNIRAIALSVAFEAAAEGGRITMDGCERAVRRELAKMDHTGGGR